MLRLWSLHFKVLDNDFTHQILTISNTKGGKLANHELQLMTKKRIENADIAEV